MKEASCVKYITIPLPSNLWRNMSLPGHISVLYRDMDRRRCAFIHPVFSLGKASIGRCLWIQSLHVRK